MECTIAEVEARASALFAALREVSLSPELAEVRDFLFPPTFTPVVQLEQDGRKKRGSAAAWNWKPEEGEITIYSEAASGTAGNNTAAPAPKPLPPTPTAPLRTAAVQPLPGPASPGAQPLPQTAPASDGVTPEEVVECCQALAAAERANRPFIALKWFLNEFLPTVGYAWTVSPQRRKKVVSYAIDIGRIDLKKLDNPKSEFATSTIVLNRSIPTTGVTPRFQPIVLRGEPLSTTILRDRGSV